uniref:DUF4065 domain-containing protein n=1 Tax=Fervidobacterium pennivorans TaxID=93466 RepID=A0A7C4VV97_FERPE
MNEERRLKLAKIVNNLRKNLGLKLDLKEFENRLRLQKYVFLLKKFGVDLGYSYNMYFYGPYSPDLAKDYYNLPETKEEEELPREFYNLVKGKSSRWLELATTLIMIKDGFKSFDEEKVIQNVAKSKSESPKKLRKIYNELREAKVI